MQFDEHIENILIAWGCRVRGNWHASLKRVRIPQFQYTPESGGCFYENLDFVEWHDRYGRVVSVPVVHVDKAAELIGRMPDIWRDVLRCRYVDRFTHAQAAEKIGRSERTAKTYLYEARVAFGLAWRRILDGVHQRGIHCVVEEGDFENPANECKKELTRLPACNDN